MYFHLYLVYNLKKDYKSDNIIIQNRERSRRFVSDHGTANTSWTSS